jgi:hypothetical protein
MVVVLKAQEVPSALMETTVLAVAKSAMALIAPKSC